MPSTVDTLIEEACEPEATPAMIDAIPPDCSPDRFVNWRFRYAMHLLDHSDGPTVTHEDPWIQAMIDFRTICELENRVPTETDIAVYNALALWRSDRLAKHLLEARLLNQQSPEEIHRRSGLPIATITAYSNLQFDVSDVNRKGIWFLHPLASAVVPQSEMSRFGLQLKSLACFSSSEELEGHIGTLLGIDGKTMAAGLPPREDAEFARQISQRIRLAQALLPLSRAVERLMTRFDELVAQDVQAGQVSAKSLDFALRILQAVKVPGFLQRAMRQLRATTCVATG